MGAQHGGSGSRAGAESVECAARGQPQYRKVRAGRRVAGWSQGGRVLPRKKRAVFANSGRAATGDSRMLFATDKPAPRRIMQVYVSKSGQRYGPYTADELRAAVLLSVFRPQHFASCDNGHTWIPISEVRGIGSFAYVVESDPPRELLTIRYRGCVAAGDVERCAEEVAAALAEMPAGFRLLADFSALEAMEASCAAPLKKIMRLCDEKGISGVVRVVPDPRRDIGLQIMSHFHYGPEVSIVTCESLEEANDVLESMRHESATVTVSQDANDE